MSMRVICVYRIYYNNEYTSDEDCKDEEIMTVRNILMSDKCIMNYIYIYIYIYKSVEYKLIVCSRYLDIICMHI